MASEECGEESSGAVFIGEFFKIDYSEAHGGHGLPEGAEVDACLIGGFVDDAFLLHIERGEAEPVKVRFAGDSADDGGDGGTVAAVECGAALAGIGKVGEDLDVKLPAGDFGGAGPRGRSPGRGDSIRLNGEADVVFVLDGEIPVGGAEEIDRIAKDPIDAILTGPKDEATPERDGFSFGLGAGRSAKGISEVHGFAGLSGADPDDNAVAAAFFREDTGLQLGLPAGVIAEVKTEGRGPVAGLAAEVFAGIWFVKELEFVGGYHDARLRQRRGGNRGEKKQR